MEPDPMVVAAGVASAAASLAETVPSVSRDGWSRRRCDGSYPGAGGSSNRVSSVSRMVATVRRGSCRRLSAGYGGAGGVGNGGLSVGSGGTGQFGAGPPAPTGWS